jgi:hypothetical protein
VRDGSASSALDAASRRFGLEQLVSWSQASTIVSQENLTRFCDSRLSHGSPQDRVAFLLRQINRSSFIGTLTALLHGCFIPVTKLIVLRATIFSRRLSRAQFVVRRRPRGGFDFRSVFLFPRVWEATCPALSPDPGSPGLAWRRLQGPTIDLDPTINIVCDPRWCRAFETLGEDRYLNGQMGAAGNTLASQGATSTTTATVTSPRRPTATCATRWQPPPLHRSPVSSSPRRPGRSRATPVSVSTYALRTRPAVLRCRSAPATAPASNSGRPRPTESWSTRSPANAWTTPVGRIRHAADHLHPARRGEPETDPVVTRQQRRTD